MTQHELIRLLDKYLAGNATAEEQAMLHAYYERRQDAGSWKPEAMGDAADAGTAMWQKIQEAIQQAEPAPVIPLYRRSWVWTAAVVIMVIGASLGVWLSSSVEMSEPVAMKRLQKQAVPPVQYSALLTLADGSYIVLDSAANGVLAQQGNTVVRKHGQRLIYEQRGTSSGGADYSGYNSVVTAKGTQFHVVLPDGSKAWLNATSALRFPLQGDTQKVRVELEGEAYFDVVHRKRVFQVAVTAAGSKARGALIEVLGTRFNVDAYADEGLARTTLLQGSVRVLADSTRRAARTLKAGEQALVTGTAPIEVQQVDVAREVAWQQGLFDFEGAGTHEVMRELSRWYDLEVVYRGKESRRRFSGRISRSLSLEGVLKILEQSGVRFDVQGRRITVLS